MSELDAKLGEMMGNSKHTSFLSFGFIKFIIVLITTFTSAYSLSCPEGQIAYKNPYYNKFDKSSELWVCYPDPNYKSAAAVQSAPLASGSTKKSNSGSSRKKSSPAQRSNSRASTVESASGQSSSSTSGGGLPIGSYRSSSEGCDFGSHRITTANKDDFTPEVGDTQARSELNGYGSFCRKDSVTAAQVAEAKTRQKADQENNDVCSRENGTLGTLNGMTACRYIDGHTKKAMVCFVEEDKGELQECEEDKTQVADGGACQMQFERLVDACKAEAQKASTDCDQENEGIQQAMDATKAVGAGSAASVQLACSKLGEISKIANVSLTGWQSFCAFSQSTCETSCSDAKKLYHQADCIAPQIKPKYRAHIDIVDDHITSCVAYKKRISEAAQHATAALVQLQAAKKCQEDAGNGLTTANLDECKKNPNNPLCTDAQRCSNAEFAAANQVCKCINNANAKECVASMSGVGSRGVAGATIPGAHSGSGANNTDPAAAFIPPTSSAENPLATSLRDGAVKNEQNLGGAKGNAGLGGASGSGGTGGVGSNAAHSAAGAGPDGDKLKINSGFYGGAPGAGGYFGNRSGVGVGARPSAGGVNYNKLGAGGAQFDPRRYIAGLNGKGGEYINGPSMDIFRIVKNRIESKKPTMLDPDFKK